MKHILKLTTLLLFLWIAKQSTGQNISVTDSTICFDKVTGSAIISEHRKGQVYKQMYEALNDSLNSNKKDFNRLIEQEGKLMAEIQEKDYKISKQNNKNLRKLVFIISENALLVIGAILFLK